MRCSESDSMMVSLLCAENVALLVTEQCMQEKWKVGKFAPTSTLRPISSRQLLEKNPDVQVIQGFVVIREGVSYKGLSMHKHRRAP